MSHLINTQPLETPERKTRGRLVGGLLMIGIGLYLLIAQFIQAEWMGLLIMPGLGLAFVLGGLLGRNAGLLVPGGILSGLGLGAYLVASPLVEAGEVAQGGVFLLAFALGWGLITLLSAVIGQRVLWPLIPGGILAVIGALLLGGSAGVQVLEWIGRLWPLALILGGLAVLFRRR